MLQINDLDFTAWGRRFFDHATVSIPPGAKVGLVGRNGIGKSTLFKLIKGELHSGGGDISMPRNARLGAVDQEHPATPDTLIETILAADVERHTLLTELESAEPERMGEIYARLIDIDADRAPSRAAEILSGLGFSQEDLGRAMAEFSGGWRMRVALAAALFAEPDVLLLDERLKKYPHTAIIISHDRELLNNSVDAILHVREGKLDYYTGGYDDFEKARAEKQRLAAAGKAKQDAERAHLQAFVDRFRAKASKAAQAQSRMKRLAKLQPISMTIEERVAPFTLPSPKRPLAPPLVRLEDASVGYDGHPILRKLNLRLDIDDRIGLLGVNGAGKSTFAKMIAGALPIMHGDLHRDKRMQVGWFHQHQIEALDPTDTPMEIVRRAMLDSSEAQRRSKLAQFGINFDKQETTVANLSGGERARLLLNLVAMSAPHMLILDEPTNHLDIDSRRMLLDALNDYEGAVILITHDRSLMELVADRLWLAADGGVKPFDGDMDDYAKFVLDRARQTGRSPTQVKRETKKDDPPAKAAPNPAMVGPLKRKLEAAEQTLARCTSQLAELDHALADPELYVKDPAKARELSERRDKAKGRMDKAEAEWMTAAEAYDAAVGA
jgi:ATP-binding cassette subfamily F protein 3